METGPFIDDFPIKTSLHEVVVLLSLFSSPGAVLRHRSHGEIFAVITACCDVRQMLPSQLGMNMWHPKPGFVYVKSTTGWWFQHVDLPL